jgi:hypothetical protein
MFPPSSGNILEVRGLVPSPNPPLLRKAPASLALLGRLGAIELELSLQYDRSGDLSLRLLSDSV